MSAYRESARALGRVITEPPTVSTNHVETVDTNMCPSNALRRLPMREVPKMRVFISATKEAMQRAR